MTEAQKRQKKAQLAALAKSRGRALSSIVWGLCKRRLAWGRRRLLAKRKTVTSSFFPPASLMSRTPLNRPSLPFVFVSTFKWQV